MNNVHNFVQQSREQSLDDFDNWIVQQYSDGYISNKIINAMLIGHQSISIVITQKELLKNTNILHLDKNYLKQLVESSNVIKDMTQRWIGYDIDLRHNYLINGDFQLIFKWV